MPVKQKLLRVLAGYSDGVRLTVEHGPQSSIVFEYAVQNEPHGHGVVGRWIDRTFLNLRSWQRIRERIGTSKALIAELVAERRAAGRSTMILDVAAGTGRYLRELVREQGGPDLVIACHDRNPRRVVHGRRLVKAEHLQNFSFSVGDASDESSYLTSQDPDIVLAIGLFPYLRDDETVRTVMRLAFARLTRGGAFICTTLARHRGGLAPWEVDGFGAQPTVRQPETVKQWMRATGFVRIDQRPSQAGGFALIGWKDDQP